MSKFDFISEVETSTAHLDETITTLSILVQELDHEMHTGQAMDIRTDPAYVLEFCAGFFVIERELGHINKDLTAVVGRAYEQLRGE